MAIPCWIRTVKNFSFTIDTEEDFRAISEAVAGQLRAIGIDASVRIWEWSVIKPLLLAGERQAFLDNWGDSAFDPVGHMEAKWHGYVENTTYGRGNFSGYNNARVNELIKLGEMTIDTTKRTEIYDEAQQLIYDEAPAIFLILPQVVGLLLPGCKIGPRLQMVASTWSTSV